MTELDKFKRRTIRSVARLLLQKKPPDELWSEMKKETGTDCRVLWERMRALCIKKLNRMLAVDDRSDTLPSIARLSLTDWLLVDLVLVHEKIDVIAMEKEDNKAEQKPLIELFSLVQRFEVEGSVGERLAEAWAAATVFYNRQGRQCSPMLLQRRWYQLKKLTRCRFYKFWLSYRGNTRLLDEAKGAMPSRLQMAVAKRYPSVITKDFPEWEELIKQRLVIMPEEFESKMRMTNLPKPCSSHDPDLVVVEPVIETIDLRVDSDPDEPKEDNSDDTSDPEKSNEATPQANETEGLLKQNNEIFGVKIKTEPKEEDGLSNVQVIAATHVPEVDIRDTDSPEPDDNPHKRTEEKNIEEKQVDSPDYEEDVIEIPNVIPVVNIDLESPTKNVVENPQDATTKIRGPDNVISINDNDEVVDDIIKIKADEFCSKDTKEVPRVTNAESLVDDLIKDKVDTFLNIPKEEINLDENKPDIKTIDSINEKCDLTAIDLMADLNFVDDGIEFVDDGVEFVEEDEATTEPVSKSPSEQSSKGDSGNKFDLKLLMDPVIYTTRLDHMNIFRNEQFDSVENKEDIEKVLAESKPVSAKSFNINMKQEDKTSQIDTEAIDDTGAIDDLFTNQEESSDEEISEIVKVSISSNMLKKPRSRSYNPIQLCKNPDFNTKLRRLNIGFFSSIRNRTLLNACIPMTIDVSKSFESKLVDGTLYLKPTGTIIKVEPEEVADTQTSSVVPAALPVQSLLDKAITNVQDLISNVSTTPDPVISERKKIISLPDIEKVRKINQQLLTAQVPPIRVYAGDARPPPPIYPPSVETVPIDQIKLPEQPTPTSPPVPNNMPTVVKVKSEANLNNESEPPVPKTDISPELPPAKKKLLKIINRAKVLTQEALTKIDVGARVSETNELKQITLLRKVNVKPKPKENFKKYNINRVSVPWTPRIRQRPEQIDDFLITSDTLNKMLHLMGKDNHESSNCACCSNKPKKPEEKKKYKKKKKLTGAQDNDKPGPVNTDGADKESKLINDQNDPGTNKATSPKPVIARGRVFRYCCWARQKILNRKRITKHTCPPEACSCCCRDELAKSLKENQEKSNSAAIELSDDEDKSLQKACESIENVVQQSRELTQVTYRLEDSASKAVVMENGATDMESVSYQLKILDRSTLSVAANETVPYVPTIETPLNAPGAKMLIDVAAAETSSHAPGSKIPLMSPLNQTPQPHATTKIVSGPLPKRKPGPKPKLTYRETKSAQCCIPTPCPCQRPAVSQDTQRNIVIDASRKCPFHIARPSIAPQNDKVVYLHSKTIAQSPSESPIFLGKNKILLTTVKFPRKEVETIPETEVFQTPKIIPTLELPPGVQLVMLASGCVTYTLDQGTELTGAQLATLPSIIAAVQEQLNSVSASIITPVKNDINPNTSSIELPSGVNVDNQTIESPVAINLEAQEVFQDVELPQKVPENAETITEVTTQLDASVEPNTTTETQPNEIVQTSAKENESTPSTEETVNATNENGTPVASNDTPLESDATPSSNESKSAVDSQIQTDKQSPEACVVEDNEKTEECIAKEVTNNRNSLLSDLMEMSGISAEDTTAVEPPTPVPVLTVNSALTDGQVPGISNAMLSVDQTRNLPELSPVTSFAELKYACEQNGKFFKLDYESGIIVPINVCIKKNFKGKPKMETKAVIDLTDDTDETTDSTNSHNAEVSPEKSLLKDSVQYLYNGQTVNVNSTVKPIKLFKACRPPLLKRSKKIDIDDLPFKKKTHVENRKQALHKLEARIDLVDSDAPMEEEYLMDSSDDEGPLLGMQSMTVEALDLDILNNSDDSSDDEPLAKKSKRMKEAQDHAEQTDLDTNVRLAMDTIDENIPISEIPPEVAENTGKGTSTPMDCEESQSDAENGQLNKDEQPVLKFMSDQSGDEGGDDCILGV